MIIKLLQEYENCMNDLDLRLKKQNNKKLTASERKENKL